MRNAVLATLAFLPRVLLANDQTCTIEQLTDDGLITTVQRPASVDFSGRRVALELSVLNAANPDGGPEIFVLDRKLGTLERMSHSSFPAEYVHSPAISGDSSRVAYQLRTATAQDLIDVLYLVERKTKAADPISPSDRSPVFHADLDGRGERSVFISPENLSGDSPHGHDHVFLRDASSGEIRRISRAPTSEPPAIDFAGNTVLIRSYNDQLGTFPFTWPQLYLYDVGRDRLSRVTETFGNVDEGAISGDGRTVVYALDGDLIAHEVGSGKTHLLVPGAGAPYPSVSHDGSRVAFVSGADLTGENPDSSPEVFLYDRTDGRLVQVTHDTFNNQYTVALNGPGDVLVFPFHGDPVGTNPDRSVEIFSAECPLGPVPPEGPPLTSSALEDFAFHVRFSNAGGTGLIGSLEPECIAETACVSGALPGRSEVFLRVVGPKPNGFLWPTLVKFSTSTVEVWIEQLSTGVRRYYRLSGARPGIDELPGLFDRAGFLAEAALSAETGSLHPAADSIPEPPGGAFTSPHFPDFRFRARISAGNQIQEVRQEAACIEETLCLSGAVPGRSEVFLRMVGPKPNGRLWPTIVKFTTSTLEVWVEQVSSGETTYYRIEGAAPGKDDLTGLFDREGFAP